MAWWHAIEPVYSVAGFVVGALVGLTGVGGGSLMTPLLVLFFGIHPATAVGTDLLYAGLTKTVGVAVHSRNRSVDWRIVGRLAAGSIPAATTTLLLTARSGRMAEGSAAVINSVLGVTLILTAVALMLRRLLYGVLARHAARLSPRRTRGLTVALGVLLGTLVTLSSVGAGAIGVTVLLILYPRLPAVRIAATDIAHAVPLTLVAGTGHWLVGAVDWSLLASLLVGSIPGIALGSQLAGRVSDDILRTVLASTLAVVGCRLAF